jgi:hypothetical protein
MYFLQPRLSGKDSLRKTRYIRIIRIGYSRMSERYILRDVLVLSYFGCRPEIEEKILIALNGRLKNNQQQREEPVRNRSW